MLTPQNGLAVLAHLVSSELAEQRGQYRSDILRSLNPDESLTDGTVAADSLEILALARRVSEFFQLQQVGSEEWLLRRRSLNEWRDIVMESLDSGIEAVGFRSGGTTGEPELRLQYWSHLRTETDSLSTLLCAPKRILALVPLHHIYGFIWGPLIASTQGCAVTHGAEAEHCVHHDLRRGDLIIGVPEWWQYLAGTGRAFPEGVTGITSTAPCPADVCHQLVDAGLQQLIEIYGASDVGGIGWRDMPENPYQLLPHWHRHGEHCLTDDEGRVVELPDHIQWETERLLIPTGRRDGAVQVGGINVWPQRVRDLLLTHEGVADCAIRPMATASGTRLKAFIVPAPGQDHSALERQLRQWLKERLNAAERPNHLTFGAVLPRNDMGKLCDW